MLSDATLAFGRRALFALLGVDALYRAESDDGDGLAVVNLAAASEFSPDDFAGYADARRCLAQLRDDAARLPEPDRRKYYDALCHSTLAFVEWRTRGLPFTSQLRDFLHVPPEPATDAELDQLRSEMNELLGRMGYSGDVRARCAAWEEKNRVPAGDVPAVLDRLLDEAWDRTEARLVKIPAPKSDGMRVEAVTGAPYNARCDYKSRCIELNVDPILTRPGLKHLATHEGYPGHYLQFKLRETWARDGAAAADGLLSLVNTASSSVFEGIGDAGIEMLDWVEGDDDRVQALLNRYRAGIGTQAAWQRHALSWPIERVSDSLRARSLAGGDGWVANRLEFIEAPARAVLIWSYWWGERVVSAAWRRVARERKGEFLRFLYGRMHSNATVGQFE